MRACTRSSKVKNISKAFVETKGIAVPPMHASLLVSKILFCQIVEIAVRVVIQKIDAVPNGDIVFHARVFAADRVPSCVNRIELDKYGGVGAADFREALS